VIFAPIKVTCQPRFVRLPAGQGSPENVDNAIASGISSEPLDECTGTVQKVSVAVTPDQKPFKTGVAFGHAWLDVCGPFSCKTFRDFHNIQIVKK